MNYTPPPNVQMVPIEKDRAAWLKQREGFTGASDSPTLLKATSWGSPYELWARATGKLPLDDMRDSERMAWGRRLEPIIAKGIAEDNGFSCVAPTHLFQDTKLRAAATLDFIVDKPEGIILEKLPTASGPGSFEIKNVDMLIARERWAGDEPALGNLIQLQHQMMVTGFAWGAIGGLIGGNKGTLYVYARHDDTINQIKDAIAEFWRRVDEDDPYDLDDSYATNEAVRTQYPTDNGELLDCKNNKDAADICAAYKTAAADESEAKKRKRLAHTQIFDLLGEHKRMLADGFSVNSTVIAREGHWVSPGSHRRLTITQRKEKELSYG